MFSLFSLSFSFLSLSFPFSSLSFSLSFSLLFFPSFSSVSSSFPYLSFDFRFAEITCPEPAVLPWSGVRLLGATGHYLVGDSVQFECRPLHELIGKQIATCLPNGTWSQAPPSCKYLIWWPTFIFSEWIQESPNITRYPLDSLRIHQNPWESPKNPTILEPMNPIKSRKNVGVQRASRNLRIRESMNPRI